MKTANLNTTDLVNAALVLANLKVSRPYQTMDVLANINREVAIIVLSHLEILQNAHRDLQRQLVITTILNELYKS